MFKDIEKILSIWNDYFPRNARVMIKSIEFYSKIARKLPALTG